MICRVFPEQKEILSQIVRIEYDAFGYGGLNEWGLLPLVRYGRVYCLKDKDRVLGSIQYMLDWNDPEKAYIVGLSIDANIRGKGFGTKLMSETIDILAKDGIRIFVLTVDPDNSVAVAVYTRKLGFIITAQRPDEYGKGIHRIEMQKTFQ